MLVNAAPIVALVEAAAKWRGNSRVAKLLVTAKRGAMLVGRPA